MIRPNPPKGRKSQVCRTHSVPLQHLWGCARVRDLTGHVHHPTAAHSQDLVGLAEQPAGADAVSVVPGELLLAAGAAVPPGLGQVGQLSTQRFMRPPERQGPAAAGAMERTYPLLLTRNKGLKTRRDAEAQLVDVGRLVLTVDLHSDAGFQGCFVSAVKRWTQEGC